MEDDNNEVQDFNINMSSFLNYFENVWIRGGKTRTGVIRKPKFDHSLWNKYPAVLLGEDVTNSKAESWNSAVKLVLDSITREESLGRAKIQSMALGNLVDSNPSRTKKRNERRQQLRSVVEQYDMLSTQDFFNMIASHYNI